MNWRAVVIPEIFYRESSVLQDTACASAAGTGGSRIETLRDDTSFFDAGFKKFERAAKFGLELFTRDDAIDDSMLQEKL
jgi:hypothetical protein